MVDIQGLTEQELKSIKVAMLSNNEFIGNSKQIFQDILNSYTDNIEDNDKDMNFLKSRSKFLEVKNMFDGYYYKKSDGVESYRKIELVSLNIFTNSMSITLHISGKESVFAFNFDEFDYEEFKDKYGEKVM